jgi:hypothetical protein
MRRPALHQAMGPAGFAGPVWGTAAQKGTGASPAAGGRSDSRASEVYVEHVLVLTLRPAQIVVMDDLRRHHSERIRRPIEARGGSLWFLPSSSPDLTFIEGPSPRARHSCGRLPRGPMRRSAPRSGPSWRRSGRPMPPAGSPTAASRPRINSCETRCQCHRLRWSPGGAARNT